MKPIFIGLSVAGVVLMAVPSSQGMPPVDTVRVQDTVGRLGPLGPLALVVFMVLAIVVSPIPSGPIAVAATLIIVSCVTLVPVVPRVAWRLIAAARARIAVPAAHDAPHDPKPGISAAVLRLDPSKMGDLS